MSLVKKTDTRQDEVTYLEHPLLKVPYELLNKRYRLTQRFIERDGATLKAHAGALVNLPGRDAQKARLVEIRELLLSMREKIVKCSEKEALYLDKISFRTDELANFAAKLPAFSRLETSDELHLFERKREDRMLVDFFLRNGYYDSAVALAKDGNVEEYVDMEVFLESRKIEEALLNRNVQPCLTWCHENKTKLKKIDSQLEFTLRQQEFVELLRADEIDDAVRHAQKYFAGFTRDGALKERVHLSMGLLTHGTSTKLDRYQTLVDVNAWTEVAALFRRDSYAMHQLTGSSLLVACIQAGMSAMKSKQCYDRAESNPECPVCIEPYRTLAEGLPYKHVSHSKLVCRITHKPMTEPMMLPNGNVYDKKSLSEMAASNNGIIICPRSKKCFKMSDLKKIYIM